MATGLFKGMRDAKVFGKGTYLNPGRYQVRVKRALYNETREQGDSYILEFVVEQSSRPTSIPDRMLNETALEYEDRIKKLPNEVGSTVSWFQGGKDKNVQWGTLKDFAASILGCKVDDPNFVSKVEDFMESTVEVTDKETGKVSGNCLAGKLIPVEVVNIITKKNKKDFGRHNWGRIIDESPAT
jgi:hypothetical protein